MKRIAIRIALIAAIAPLSLFSAHADENPEGLKWHIAQEPPRALLEIGSCASITGPVDVFNERGDRIFHVEAGDTIGPFAGCDHKEQKK